MWYTFLHISGKAHEYFVYTIARTWSCKSSDGSLSLNKSFNTIRNETKISIMVMAYCLKAPSHYLNQCRLGNSDVLWHSHKGNFTERITIWVSKLLIHNYSHIFQEPMSYINDDVIKRKHFPRYWPFVRVIHWSHWGRDKMATISQTTFSNAFPCMEMFKFRLIFHRSLFPGVQLMILQHWFR